MTPEDEGFTVAKQMGCSFKDKQIYPFAHTDVATFVS